MSHNAQGRGSPLLVLRLFLPLASVLAAGAWFYGDQAIQRELMQIRQQETTSIKLGAGALSGAFEFIGHDLMFLSRHSTLRHAIDEPSPKNIALLTEDFSTFSGTNTHYDQIRWIDERGMEVVRVDYVQGKPVPIPADRLQNKGQRYFFTDTIKLNAGEVFVSPLDLNIEQGKIELPYKPMLRIATPVFDHRGNRRGIVILNYYGSKLLQAFADETAGIADHSMIVNSEGYWLKSPNPADEWGFMFKRPDLSLASRAPAAWERIRNTDTGQVELEDGLWTWETVYPLQAGQESSTGAAEAAAPSRGKIEQRQYLWKSVAHYSAASLNTLRQAVWEKAALITGILLAFAGVVSWLLAHAWETLSSERLKFRTVANYAYDWETWLAPDGQYMYCSPSCTRITGHSVEEFLSDRNLLLSITYLDDRARVEAHLRRHQASDPPCEFDFRIVLPDGQVRWLEHACISVFGDSGEFLGRRASNRDITERKQAEAALRESEERLKDAQRISQTGNWELDLVQGRLSWSDEIFRLFEIDPEKFEATYEGFLNAIHPDDRDAVNAAYNRSLQNHEPYEITHRLQMPDGRIKWVIERCDSFFDAEGRAIRSVGTIQDITERKQTETALHESHQQMYLLLDSMAEGAYGVDINGYCTFANRSFLKILGYRHADEIIGRHIHELIHHSHPDGSPYPESECKMYDAYRRNREVHVSDEVFWNKQGIAIPVEYRASPLLVEGVIVGAIATFVDITERKLAEAKIHNLAFYDALTHLPNRRLLNDRLDHAMAASKRNGNYGALMFMDLDNFKPLNDKYGHAVGDLLLTEVARRISGCVREMDTVARFGGDEFVVLLTELDADKAEAIAHAGIIAEKIRLALSAPYLLNVSQDGHTSNKIEHRCTSSIGAVLFINHEASAEEIMKRADTAMYQAKKAGRNRVYFDGEDA